MGRHLGGAGVRLDVRKYLEKNHLQVSSVSPQEQRVVLETRWPGLSTHRLKPEHWGPLFSNLSAGKARLQAKASTDLGLNLENRFPVLIQ